MTTCSESGQVRKEAAIRSLCRASESIERTGFLFARFYQTAQCSTLRDTQGDNLSFKRQGMTRRSMPCLFHAATGSDHAVNRAAIKDEARRLFQSKAEIALFYFSGHGYIESTGGFINGSDSTRGDEGLSLRELVFS